MKKPQQFDFPFADANFALVPETTADGHAITRAQEQSERDRAANDARQFQIPATSHVAIGPADCCPTCAMLLSQCQCWDPVNHTN